MRALALVALFVVVPAGAEEFVGPATTGARSCMLKCLKVPKAPADPETVVVCSSSERTGYSYMVNKTPTSWQGVATAAKQACVAKCLPLRVQTAEAACIGIGTAGDGSLAYKVVR